MSMKTLRLSALALSFAAFLAACGGGGTTAPSVTAPAAPLFTPGAGVPNTVGSFSRLVVFGDSLSDGGAYFPLTSGGAATNGIGGKFTTNSGAGPNGTVANPLANGSMVWPEMLATNLRIATTPAVVGAALGPAGSAENVVVCPAAAAGAAAANTCTNYAQGGARVSNPQGIGRPTAAGAGALTYSMDRQITNHLARFTNFTANDLVFLFGGNNDIFVQFSTFAASGQTLAQAQANVRTAATQLVGLTDRVLANGGRYVAVMTLPDSSRTPFGRSLPSDDARFVLSGLVQLFNQTLLAGLNGKNVQVIDAYTLNNRVIDNPGTFGITNNTTPACDSAKISAATSGSITDGSSLFCSTTLNLGPAGTGTLAAGASATTYQFADGVHPTTKGHQVLTDAIAAEIKRFGWTN